MIHFRGGGPLRSIPPSVLSYLLALPSVTPAAMAQTAGTRLIVSAVNINLTARIGIRNPAPAVTVLDENTTPVPGATVMFTITSTDPKDPSAHFPDGTKVLRVESDANGGAVAQGFQPNNVRGKYTIEVTAARFGMQPPPNPTTITVNNVLEIRTLSIEAGDTFVNNLCKHTGGEPKVQVRDETGRPVIGAEVTFRAPPTGASGVFTGARKSAQLATDQDGKAVIKGFVPNREVGDFQVAVHAALANLGADGAVAGSNVKQACFPAWVIAAIAGGVGGGAAAALAGKGKGGGNPSTTPPTPSVSLTPGAPSFGAPH